ncbi:MAG: calcium/sodium antiporter [Desulfonatronovibrio sp.]|nr:calcium/sodium antiporter [Desulfovibrionales bacterium]
MESILNSFLLAISALFLWFGAVWIVDSASAIAKKFRLSELTIGLTIVALGTSLPEFLVTLTAAVRGLGDISLSNVIGSNIFNLGIILGIAALIAPIPANKTLIRRDGLFLILISLFIFFMMLDLTLNRITGFLLFSAFLSYNLFVFFRGARINIELNVPEETKAGTTDYLKLFLGFVLISLGGYFMVEGASSLAELMGVSQWVIGVTIVAAGTSLPELITCVVAAIKKKNDMLLGNLIGSDIFNFAGVLGLTCLINPITISGTAIPSMISLIVMIVLVLIFMRTGFRINRWEGMALIALGLGRWTLDFLAF